MSYWWNHEAIRGIDNRAVVLRLKRPRGEAVQMVTNNQMAKHGPGSRSLLAKTWRGMRADIRER